MMGLDNMEEMIKRFSYYGYYLPVTYTPNDQTSIQHDILIEKSYFDNSGLTEETLAEAMKSDTNPFNPFDTYWNSVGAQEVPWNCTPGETY